MHFHLLLLVQGVGVRREVRTRGERCVSIAPIFVVNRQISNENVDRTLVEVR